MLATYLAGLPMFAAYLAIAVAALLAFTKVYTAITPHDEGALISNGNNAAAVSYLGAKLGLALPIASAAANSVSIVDFVLWTAIACVVQIVTFFSYRMFYPTISASIEKGDMAPALRLAGTSVLVGLLNAACMTY